MCIQACPVGNCCALHVCLLAARAMRCHVRAMRRHARVRCAASRDTVLRGEARGRSRAPGALPSNYVKTEPALGPPVKSVKTEPDPGPPVKSVKVVKPPVKTTEPSGPLLPPYRVAAPSPRRRVGCHALYTLIHRLLGSLTTVTQPLRDGYTRMRRPPMTPLLPAATPSWTRATAASTGRATAVSPSAVSSSMRVKLERRTPSASAAVDCCARRRAATAA